MTASESILKIVPMGMSLGLAADNFNFVQKAKDTKEVIGQGIKNIVGVNLIKSTAQFI